jgi:nuclear pore complex protein Nup53
MMRAEQHSEDTWVTVFGFAPDDLPLVLQEFQRCGDILQWGTFGASPQSNFMHLQYQNKYGAQRALLKAGEQLSSSLIIGVKQLEPKHRALVQAWATGADGSPGPRMKSATGPVRPYRVELPQAQVLPQRSRSWYQKVGEYVFGL